MAQLNDLIVNGNTRLLNSLNVNGLAKITNNGNTTTIGAQNSAYCHVYNSANIPFIVNKSILCTSGDLGNTSYPFSNLYLTTNINLRTPSSSSDDSGDIVWYYGNGKEKSRIWTANDYTSKSGPQYRVYKSDGTSLYSGTLPLADGTGASGTWGVSVSGNAATATKLATTRKIFNKDFDGSADVAGQALTYGTYTATASSRYSNGALQIRECGLVGSAQSDIGYAPSIGFHWGGRVGANLLLHSDGNFYFRKQDGTTRATIDANVVGNADTATTATKLGSSTVGGTTTPIYLNAGTPTALSYTIAKSVPSDAKFTDTTYSAGTGLSLSSTTFSINNSGVSPYEAKLQWGGNNFTGSFGCLDAAMVDELGANRFMFTKAAGITIEYTRNAGSTWTDYGATDVQKVSLFSNGYSFYIGKADSTNKATANGDKYQLRITIDTGASGIYTALNKFILYISTNGSASSTVTIQKALQSTPTTYTDVATNISISGWSGYNVINFPAFTTYGNTAASQYGRVRFIFKANGGDTNYVGLTVSKIMGFGGVGWTTPSTMAKTGHLYAFDSSQNATFPANLKINGGTNQVGYLTATPTSGQIMIADGTAGGIKASGYTIATSVPSNAVFTDTNNAVTQTATTGSAEYECLFSVTADNTTRTEGARKSDKLKFNPSTGRLSITPPAANTAFPSGGIAIYDTRNIAQTPASITSRAVNFFFSNNTMPSTAWWSGMHVHGWDSGYNAWELVGPATSADSRTTPLYVRTSNASSAWGSWRKIYDTSNPPTASEVGALASTVKYAGASTAGGAATSAAKLTNTSKIGDTNKPVYFSANGVPVAISYTIEKSVPSDAKFTDTTYSTVNATYTLTKSSGTWTAGSVTAKRFGNVVHIAIAVTGTGTSVAALTNGFVGKITAGSGAALPALSIHMPTLYNRAPLTCTVDTSGNVTFVNSGFSAITIPNGTSVYAYGIFVVA